MWKNDSSNGVPWQEKQNAEGREMQHVL